MSVAPALVGWLVTSALQAVLAIVVGAITVVLVGKVAAPVWKMEMPADCPTCSGLRDLYDAARRKQPASRYAHLTYDRDGTIATAFGYTVAQYPQVIDTFVSSIAADPNAKMMLVQLPAGATSHVVQSAPRNAVDYLPWMTRMLADDPAWTSTTITQ